VIQSVTETKHNIGVPLHQVDLLMKQAICPQLMGDRHYKPTTLRWHLKPDVITVVDTWLPARRWGWSEELRGSTIARQRDACGSLLQTKQTDTSCRCKSADLTNKHKMTGSRYDTIRYDRRD